MFLSSLFSSTFIFVLVVALSTMLSIFFSTTTGVVEDPPAGEASSSWILTSWTVSPLMIVSTSTSTEDIPWIISPSSAVFPPVLALTETSFSITTLSAQIGNGARSKIISIVRRIICSPWASSPACRQAGPKKNLPRGPRGPLDKQLWNSGDVSVHAV